MERWSSTPPKTFLHFNPISISTNCWLATTEILLQTFFNFFHNIEHCIDCVISLEKILIEKELRFRISWKPSCFALAFTPSAQPLPAICVSEKREDKCRPNDRFTESITSINRNKKFGSEKINHSYWCVCQLQACILKTLKLYYLSDQGHVSISSLYTLLQ
jgi:hypothetical protein